MHHESTTSNYKLVSLMLASAKHQQIVIESAFIYRIIIKSSKILNIKVVKSAFIHKIVNLF